MLGRVAVDLKERAKSSPRIYELIRKRRAAQLEREYIGFRDHYYRQAPDVFRTGAGTDPAYDLLRATRNVPKGTKPALSAMRIFVAAADDLGGPRVLNSLRRVTDCITFDLAGYRTPFSPEATADLRWRDELQADLKAAFWKAHEEEPVDLVFAYGSRYDFEPETLNAIRTSGVPLALLCLDDKHSYEADVKLPFPNGQKPLIGAADIHLTNSRECVRWYLAEQAPSYYMPQGVDEEYFHPTQVPQDVDVSFVGQRYGYRASLMDHLRSSGVDVACFGGGWGTRQVSEQEKVELYSRSRINLGVGGVEYSDEITCIKGRDFEATAAGGLYLTSYDAELAGLFRVGEEIVCYRDKIDCVELIRYYLERPDESRRIAEAGRARCLRDHTWRKRFEDFLGWIGLLDK